MQALKNYEKELRKAFAKMENDLERHKDIFKRLESELQAVEAFEQPDYAEALDNMRKRDSELYAAIRDAYEREQFDGNPEKHVQGIIAAIEAIYNLGFAQGFTQGAQAERMIRHE